MKSTILISGKNKKKYFNMSSAENLTRSATRLIIQNDVECEIVLVF